jgi:hypothetical protein
MTSVDEIENHIKDLLLTEVTFTVENKIIKKGKLILFSVKDFFCVFTLVNIEKSNRHVVYELPYPFSIAATDKSIIFDYTLNSFCLNTNIKQATEAVNTKRTSKFFNKKVVVSIL